MNILVIGELSHLKECQNKFGSNHSYRSRSSHADAKTVLTSNDLIFDFIIDRAPQEFVQYTSLTVTIFLNTCKISLQQLAHMAGNKVNCTLFGFNGLPTFVDRNVLEVSLWQNKNADRLKELCGHLATDYLVVDDRVGLVTPRVVCMIINEAYYTVQEGTASREDIDMAMKLGTNYPYGPFEWCQRIGLDHVYELLEAIYKDTKDERYKICPLLKKEYLAR
jgi:3-hydroxybutyryl-CoA dehydrogenase